MTISYYIKGVERTNAKLVGLKPFKNEIAKWANNRRLGRGNRTIDTLFPATININQVFLVYGIPLSEVPPESEDVVDAAELSWHDVPHKPRRGESQMLQDVYATALSAFYEQAIVQMRPIRPPLVRVDGLDRILKNIPLPKN